MRSLKKGAYLALAMVLAGTPVMLSAAASNVVKPTRITGTNFVKAGDYYTQVIVDAQDAQLPIDDKGKRNLGEALLKALGLNDKTRSLTITMVLNQNGQSLPEIPLLSYEFDGKKTLTNIKKNASYVSPRWQMDTGSPVSVTLKYYYSTSANYDVAAITGNIQKVIPSKSIVTALTGPLFTGVAGLTASIFSAAEQRTVDVTNTDNLTPFEGAINAQGLTFAITTPKGDSLGTITARLAVTPTLSRQAKFVDAANPAADLVWDSSASVSDLVATVDGTERYLLVSTMALSEYGAMVREPSPATVGAFCTKAREGLVKTGITSLDRTMVMYQSLRNAGFKPGEYHPKANGWVGNCFDDAGLASLAKAVNVTAALPAAPVTDAGKLTANWDKEFKYPFGCWITGKTGPDCQKAAGTESVRAFIERRLADTVEIQVVKLPGIEELVPGNRIWPKADLIEGIAGKAQGFSCFSRGMLLSKDGQFYNMTAEVKDKKIVRLQILAATEDDISCL
jgi:hypothetical protein